MDSPPWPGDVQRGDWGLHKGGVPGSEAAAVQAWRATLPQQLG